MESGPDKESEPGLDFEARFEEVFAISGEVEVVEFD